MVQKNLLKDAWQTSPLSIFNACSQQPLALFSICTDSTLPQDSGLALINDADDKIVWQSPSKGEKINLIKKSLESDKHLYRIQDHSLHIQSPSIEKTYIRCPPNKKDELGINLPILHLQIYLFDHHHPFMFEVSIKDDQNRIALLRWSTFKSSTSLYHYKDKTMEEEIPLLHMPLRLAIDESTKKTTEWCTIIAPLQTIAKQISVLESSAAKEDGNQSFTNFHSVLYIKIYANCRLRRIWFTNQNDHHKPNNFQLYRESD